MESKVKSIAIDYIVNRISGEPKGSLIEVCVVSVPPIWSQVLEALLDHGVYARRLEGSGVFELFEGVLVPAKEVPQTYQTVKREIEALGMVVVQGQYDFK